MTVEEPMKLGEAVGMMKLGRGTPLVANLVGGRQLDGR